MSDEQTGADAPEAQGADSGEATTGQKAPPQAPPESQVPPEPPEPPEPPSFTQEDVNKLVAKARAEERRKASERFGDYDEVKTSATTAEQRLAELEQRYAAAEAKALRSDIAAAHGISPEDRDLFLTGSDEETLRAQAERLAAHLANRERASSIAPREGANPTSPPLGTDEAFAAAIAEALNRAR